MSALQNSCTNLSSAAGLGLIGFNENDIAVDYGCMCLDSFVYTSRLCRKIAGILPSYERLKTLQKRLVEEDVKNYDLTCFFISAIIRLQNILLSISLSTNLTSCRFMNPLGASL